MSIKLEKINSEIIDNESDTSSYKILSYPADFTLEGLFLKWEKGEIIIPSFQRKYVWSQSQASRLIESFLLGLPVPGIFLFKDSESDNLLVIDGQQRLKSVASFFKGKFPLTNRVFTLQKIREPWNGLSFEELSEKDKSQLKNSVLRATVIQQLDPDDDTSIFHIFERLNTGGTSLTQQEVRNCIYHGTFNDLINELNENKFWREIVGKPVPDIRMRDTELVLRMFAITQSVDTYTKPMKEFLSQYMKKNRNNNDQKISELRIQFETACENVVKNLGKKPFHLRQGLNVPACEAVMSAFMSNKTIPENIKSRYIALTNHEKFKEDTSDATTDIDVVKRRNKLAQHILFD